jgi:hypothetical protein
MPVGFFVQAFVIFVENGFRHHVFLRGPIAEVEQPAPLAAERELFVCRGVR